MQDFIGERSREVYRGKFLGPSLKIGSQNHKKRILMKKRR